jgi:hypothetical protein
LCKGSGAYESKAGQEEGDLNQMFHNQGLFVLLNPN